MIYDHGVNHYICEVLKKRECNEQISTFMNCIKPIELN